MNNNYNSSHPRSTKALQIKGVNSNLIDSPGSNESIANRLRRRAEFIQSTGSQSEYPILSEELQRPRNEKVMNPILNQIQIKQSKDLGVKKSLSPLKSINNLGKVKKISTANIQKSSLDSLKQQVSNLLQLDTKEALLGGKFRLSRSSEGTTIDETYRTQQPQLKIHLNN